MFKLLLTTSLAVFAFQAPSAPPAPTLPLDQIKLPPGFSIAVYATGVENARQMALGENGTLFVGSRTARKVFAIVDSNGDHKADKVVAIANGLTMPSGGG